ncbi:MAG: SDR family NAD(P)-dependent oxidoreductase [Acidimicrobiia bacterium]
MTFGATTTTDEVLDGLDLTGKRYLVTGASTGLGEETTRALAAHGAAVTMAVRDVPKGEAAATRVRESVSDARVEVRELDLASLASVRAFAGEFRDACPRLDALVNNAGVMACPHGTTADGFELQIGTNHIGHFLLTVELLDRLDAGSRVVALSSAGHRFSDVDLDDPNFERTEYEPWVAYGRSKTANALFAVELDRRLRERGAHAFSLHPGGIMTELGRHLTEETMGTLAASIPAGQSMDWKTVPQGAATTVFALTAPELEEHGGAYLEDCAIAVRNDEAGSRGGIRSYAIDPDRAAALWQRSEEWVRN